MTSGQKRAIVELQRIAQAAPDDLEVEFDDELKGNALIVKIELRIGPIDKVEGGLCFHERETFTLRIPSEFPFQYPQIEISHRRFSGFPHVIWGRWLCLYKSLAQWNPEDGMYGFFDRLYEWIGRAAINNMDPVDGNLEPPHHLTAMGELPFVIRENAPTPPGESWIGVAQLKKHSNRIELIGWSDLDGDWPKNCHLALATMLPGTLPMEFPQLGKELFAEFTKQGLGRDKLLTSLKLAALFSEEGAPVHFVVGLPMRRSADGDTQMHIAVWAVSSAAGDLLRQSVAEKTDNDEIRQLRAELAEALFEIVEKHNVSWCKVMEDREEIIVRRDTGTPLGGLKDKKVLILGCGALGSWVAEMISRSSPSGIDLVDSGIVKPGILIRQNFGPDDYGSGKAQAIAARISKIAPDVGVGDHRMDAHAFIVSNPTRFASYDLVLDCTASPIFQMKLERDWTSLGGQTPRMSTMFIDAQAKRMLAMSIDSGAPAGIWDGLVRLKHRLCLEDHKDLVDAFYSDSTDSSLFQPEPGCSDPTFVGSMADVIELSAATLNRSLLEPPSPGYSLGFGIASTRCSTPTHHSFLIKNDLRVDTPNARVHFSDVVFKKARSYVRQNARERSSTDETGGLLWGRWDEAVGVVWVFDLSGPPPDSSHHNGRFLCGVEGTREEHTERFRRSGGTSGFLGFWHTHPMMKSEQSVMDIGGMGKLVSSIGDNQRRALMLIFGQGQGTPTAGIYIYESQASFKEEFELVSIGEAQIELRENLL